MSDHTLTIGGCSAEAVDAGGNAIYRFHFSGPAGMLDAGESAPGQPGPEPNPSSVDFTPKRAAALGLDEAVGLRDVRCPAWEWVGDRPAYDD